MEAAIHRCKEVIELINYVNKTEYIDFRIGYFQFFLTLFVSYLLPAAFLALIIFVGIFNAQTIFFAIFLFFYILFGDFGFKDYLKNYTHYTVDFLNNEIRFRNMFLKKSKVIKKSEIKQISFEIGKLRHQPAHWLTFFLNGGGIVRLNLSYYKGVNVPHSLFMRYPSLYLPWFRFIEKDRILGYENVLNYFVEDALLADDPKLFVLAYLTKVLNIDLKTYLVENGYFEKKRIKKFYEKNFIRLEKWFFEAIE